jgi:hypothetical protein
MRRNGEGMEKEKKVSRDRNESGEEGRIKLREN